MKVYLGGTYGKNDYRVGMIPQLYCDYYNPKELQNLIGKDVDNEEKEKCNKILYVFTGEMRGFSGINDVVNDSRKYKERVILCILYSELSSTKCEILKDAENTCIKYGSIILRSIEEVVQYLNEQS